MFRRYRLLITLIDAHPTMAEAEELNISCLQQKVFLIVTSDDDQDQPSTSSGIRVPRKKKIRAGHRASATRIPRLL